MSMTSSRRAGILLLRLFFHVAGVLGRGGGKGGDEGGEEGEGGTIADGADTGSDIGDAASSGLDLPPELNAVFAITIIIGVITALQFIRSLARFKHLPSRGSELTLAHNVGVLFPIFLTVYTAVYTINNALYAVYIASFGDTFFLPFTFGIGMAFTGQLSTVLFYATFLTIIAYRLRVQLNPHENLFKLKSLLDSLLLTTILFLGVAEDIIAGTSTSLKSEVAIINLGVAFQVFGLLTSLDVAISAFIARARLSNAGIHDKVCQLENCGFLVLTPFHTRSSAPPPL
jgi:hypothetical protein